MNTRTSMVAAALLAALSACGDDPADPPGSTPDVDAGTAKDDAGVADPDTGTKPPPDAGPAKADAGPVTPADIATLNALAGRYLLRFDNFGTTTASGFTVRSRVSLLFTAELSVDGAKLTAKERVCDQTVEQRCESGCTTAMTVVDPRAISDFLVKRTFAREYTVDGSSFSAGHSVAAIGYDENGNTAMPTGGADSRVWDVLKGEPREGLLTQLTVIVAAGLPTVSCKVYGVQKVDSAFVGAIQGTGASATFTSAALIPDLTNSDGVTLGSDNALCNAQDVSSPLEKYDVRIARFGAALGNGETWACPSTAEFNTKLPGGAL